MTPTEQAVLAAARRYWDANAEGDDRTIEFAQRDLVSAALGLHPVAEVKTPLRPWPDPEAYTALAAEVFGEAPPRCEVSPAVAAWKALQHGERVMCARGHQWTADRSTGRLRFVQARKDGSPGKTIDQPWHPLIMARLPVWPIVIEADA